MFEYTNICYDMPWMRLKLNMNLSLNKSKKIYENSFLLRKAQKHLFNFRFMFHGNIIFSSLQYIVLFLLSIFMFRFTTAIRAKPFFFSNIFNTQTGNMVLFNYTGFIGTSNNFRVHVCFARANIFNSVLFVLYLW